MRNEACPKPSPFVGACGAFCAFGANPSPHAFFTPCDRLRGGPRTSSRSRALRSVGLTWLAAVRTNSGGTTLAAAKKHPDGDTATPASCDRHGCVASSTAESTPERTSEGGGEAALERAGPRGVLCSTKGRAAAVGAALGAAKDGGAAARGSAAANECARRTPSCAAESTTAPPQLPPQLPPPLPACLPRRRATCAGAAERPQTRCPCPPPPPPCSPPSQVPPEALE